MSHNDSDIHCGDFPQKISASILPPIIITELLLGLPGNLIALGIFCFRFRFWRPTILFLFNLVLADFLLLMSLPFRIDNLLRGENWVFGDAWCRINLFMIAVNRSASIGFMTAVALDRYFKVVHPLHKVNFMRLRHVAMTVCFIWTVAIALRLPLLVNNDVLRKLENDSYENASLTNKTDENIYLCRSFHPYENPPLSIQLHYLVYILEFFFPLLLILFCSIQIYCVLRQRQVSKKKNLQAMRIVLVIVGVFIICFGPGVVTGLSALYLKTLGNDYCTAFKLNSEVFIVFIGFTYLNSVLDPIIYCFSGSLFRDTFKGSIYHWFENCKVNCYDFKRL
ncbi:hydroxycarboxylic acid receptor 2-like [Electrophorus electricus]|uniref:hydroxycarboxylic acid receptor 2-like n=1 Tax=Electrophorus electricus TaxID=8005 RepID=UPI0015CF8F05|nr:hydroxycarboxylic acid receptor 2-like [Electrophorus electricus]